MMQSAGMQAIDEIVPTLLGSLEDDETSDTALDGLKQILRFLFCSNKGNDNLLLLFVIFLQLANC